MGKRTATKKKDARHAPVAPTAPVTATKAAASTAGKAALRAADAHCPLSATARVVVDDGGLAYACTLSQVCGHTIRACARKRTYARTQTHRLSTSILHK